MRRILGVICLLFAVGVGADERYVDDVYYAPILLQDDSQNQRITPYYDTKQIKELVFSDTVYSNLSAADTVKSRVTISDDFVVNDEE